MYVHNDCIYVFRGAFWKNKTLKHIFRGKLKQEKSCGYSHTNGISIDKLYTLENRLGNNIRNHETEKEM